MDPLSARLAELCRTVGSQLDPSPARDEVEAVHARLGEPLRIAVIGLVSAGKSTIVNALLGRRVAPTAAGECTRIVTWYRSQSIEGAEVVLRNGDARPLGLDNGRLPEEIGIDHHEVATIRVGLQNDRLQDMIVIDTPGLDAPSADASERTESFVGARTASAVGQADAVIYVFKEPPGKVDARVLEALRAQLAGLRISAFNAVGALNMADKIGDPDRASLADAHEIASRYEDRLSTLIGAIIPTVGLLAQTAAADLRESDVRALRALADLPPSEREMMLLSGDRFLSMDCAVSPDERARLLRLLDLFGLRQALTWMEAGISTAHELQDQLTQLSGIERLRDFFDSMLVRRSGPLKAQAALRRLKAIAYSPQYDSLKVLRELRADLDDVVIEPTMHSLQEAWALQQLSSAQVELPEGLAGDLRRLATGISLHERLGLNHDASSAEYRAAISNRVDEWNRLLASAGGSRRTVAQIAFDSYQYMLREIDGGR